MQSNLGKGFFLSLAATALIASNYVTAKYALAGFNPWTFSVVWCSAASIYSFIIVLVNGQVRQVILGQRSLLAMLYMGLATAAAMMCAWTSLTLLNPAFASFLFRFGPVLTIVLAVVFLSEKLPRRLLGPAAVMIGGGLVSAVGRWHIVALGMVLALLACCAAATERLIAKAKVCEVPPNIIVFYRVFIAAMVVALVTFAIGKADFNVEGKYWAVLLLGAFLGPCLAHAVMFRSYLHWDISRTSIVLTAMPLFVLPLAYLALGKFPAGMELVGGLIILVGAFWLALANR